MGLTPGEIVLIACLFALPVVLWLGGVVWRRVFGADEEKLRERRRYAVAYARGTVVLIIVGIVVTFIITLLL